MSRTAMTLGRRRSAVTPERRMLARATAVLACRIAAGFLAALTLLGFSIYRVVLTEQHNQARQQLEFELAFGNPDQTTPCLWLFEIVDGQTPRGRAAPEGLPLASAVAAARDGAPPKRTSWASHGAVYDVLTVRHGDVVRQAVLDTWYQQADLDHLVRALVLVGLLGVGAATIVGAEVGRRSIAPLGDALAKQRRFVADASHELRTPLTRLHTRAQLLLRKPAEQVPEPLAKELGALVRAAGELNELIEDLLVSAALHNDPERSRIVDLAALALEAAEAERPRLNGRTLEVEIGDCEAAADAACAFLVNGADSPLRRMIATLLDNAIGHTEASGRIRLRIRSADRGLVELEVTDDGTGFDQADSERIFERFAQSGHPGPHRFGLGLALAREIAADHAGTIRAESRPGRGAIFTVRLPAAKAAVEPTPVTQASS
ncbi:HAMP domain-containing histidine kinase [Actinocrinis puniceicyclus]|uniref:Sensor-like histidine kinase SenX3 n=1 Tax=Actinocrinis puniceicyclus TaxID=977794 RepID=A0A8J7WI89_9ACTN|nr:HAMP domain-containing sensor histidine kinase [Actinocrinis puniceicyclus]MBS2962743.1 HAMP domain-containing histidine kinase [Actinocrinis puniceicyclus]